MRLLLIDLVCVGEDVPLLDSRIVRVVVGEDVADLERPVEAVSDVVQRPVALLVGEVDLVRVSKGVLVFKGLNVAVLLIVEVDVTELVVLGVIVTLAVRELRDVAVPVLLVLRDSDGVELMLDDFVGRIELEAVEVADCDRDSFALRLIVELDVEERLDKELAVPV